MITKGQVIELARKAGMGGMLTDVVCSIVELERLVTLVRDHYRAKLLAVVGGPLAFGIKQTIQTSVTFTCLKTREM